MTERVVMCVDDEPNILQSLKRLLRRESYELLTVSDPGEALALLKDRQVHTVISDQRMPQMSGTELLHTVRERYPHIVRIILSGYADMESITEAVNRGQIHRFICKPWNDEDLKLTVRQAIEQYEFAEHNRLLTEQVRTQNEELKHLNEMQEYLVAERTRALEITQDILGRLPVPIMGIGAEGMIAFVNEAVKRLLPGLRDVAIGDDARASLPEMLAIQIDRCLRETTTSSGITNDVGPRAVRFNIEPLLDKEQARGCLLIFHEHWIRD
jgi:response regulator RpfG family c-di-GMP phosphodiesterase